MKGYGVAGGFLRETPVSVLRWQGTHKAWSVLSGGFAGKPTVLVTHFGSYIRAAGIQFEFPALLICKKETGIEAQCNSQRQFSQLKSDKFCKNNSHNSCFAPVSTTHTNYFAIFSLILFSHFLLGLIYDRYCRGIPKVLSPPS